jgi:hypothetical protein
LKRRKTCGEIAKFSIRCFAVVRSRSASHPVNELENKMHRLRLHLACIFFVTILTMLLRPALGAEESFPFDRELMLDKAPMRGSKRIPIIEITENGAISIQLWCASLRGRANVAAGSIAIVVGEAPPAPCGPERQSGDANLLAALAQVTNWRRRGDVVEFLGTTKLRFRLMTN